jgi:hypothetical protein
MEDQLNTRMCITVAVLGILVATTRVAFADSSTTIAPDKRQIITVTTRTQSECTIYSPQGALMCTRTYPITDHRAAVARCNAIKC